MGPVIRMWRSMYHKRLPREGGDGVRGGSEVAGCEYNNLGLRFKGGRKRVVEFVQVVLLIGCVIADTILPHIML